jgi:hypothetical protein
MNQGHTIFQQPIWFLPDREFCRCVARYFAQVLITIARPLYVGDSMDVDLDQSLYALDSTTIDLCLMLFPWAKFRKHKGTVTMHTLLDLHGSIPAFIHILTARCTT